MVSVELRHVTVAVAVVISSRVLFTNVTLLCACTCIVMSVHTSRFAVYIFLHINRGLTFQLPSMLRSSRWHRPTRRGPRY